MWIDSRWKGASSVSSLLPRMFTVLCVELTFGVAAQVCAGQITIASRQNHDFYISLMNKSGKLTQKSEYCVLFSPTNGEPTQVQDVIIEFAQQVGKIPGRPKKYSLSPDNLGRYCGEINLGKQYYRPAFYYIGIRYADSFGNGRKCRFFLTLK
jgi:hypothetical protein